VVHINTGTATTAYTYYGDGNLDTVTDPDGNVITYQYNDQGQESSETWRNAAGVVTNTVNYTYTSDGDVAKAADNNSDYNYTYDTLDRLSSVSNAGTPGGVPTVVLTSGYDSDSNRTSLSSTINGQGDFINTYGYDADDRETSVTQSAANEWSDYSYGGFDDGYGGYGGYGGGYGGQTYETPVGYGGDAVAYKQADFSYNADSAMTGVYEYGWQIYPYAGDSSGLMLAGEQISNYDNDGRLTGLTDYAYGGDYGGSYGGY
jgi:YD repeat-containing protein